MTSQDYQQFLEWKKSRQSSGRTRRAGGNIMIRFFVLVVIVAAIGFWLFVPTNSNGCNNYEYYFRGINSLEKWEAFQAARGH